MNLFLITFIIILIIVILLLKDYIFNFLFNILCLPISFKNIKKNLNCSNKEALNRAFSLCINPFKKIYTDEEMNQIYLNKNKHYLNKHKKKSD